MEMSVIVPTYNRAPLLDRTLAALAGQRPPRGGYEVVVGDDGSTDDTAAVVARYADRIPVRRVWQEDLGFRAARARNIAAAEATGRILVFVDSGVITPSGFLTAHLAAHDRAADDRVVLGYLYGYDKLNPDNLVTAADLAQAPDTLVARLRADGRCPDMREVNFRQAGDDLTTLAAPFVFFWTANVSVPAAAFRAVGGFDDTFVGWGGEDIDLGYRLFRAGLPFTLSRDAAAVEFPHPRDRAADLRTHHRNFVRIVRKHRDPLVELAAACKARFLHERRPALLEALDQRRRSLRAAPIASAPGASAPVTPPGGRTLVVGADLLGTLPARPERCIEPDAALLPPGGTAEHGYGLRTGADPGTYDTCLLSDSLRGYPGWARETLVAHAGDIAHRALWWPSGEPVTAPATPAGAGAA